MGKNRTTKYGPVVQLLLIAGAVATPFLAFNLMDLELFSVTCITLFSWIKPWLCPPYVYILINFIIFFIAASSSFRSPNPNIVFNPPTTDDHHPSLTDDSFIQSSLVCQSLVVGPSLDDQVNLHTLEGVLNDRHADEGKPKEVVSESHDVVDKRELRKSKTFHEGESRRPRGRRERYVRILSQEELDRQVEAFIYRCKQDTNLHNSET